MIDRALGFAATQSYYFQLYPVNLILLQEPVPSPESKFKFSIYKGRIFVIEGMQKFDQNKIPTEANFIESNGTHIMPFRGCQLNFYVPNFNANRKTTFTLKLNEKQPNQEYELGGIDIDPATYIAEFKQKGQNRFEEKVQISETYAVQFEMYLQKSRFALEKIVKSFKTERTLKSPVRQRKSPVHERRTPTEEVRTPISESRSPVRQRQPETVKEPAANKSRSNVAERSEQKIDQVKREEPSTKPNDSKGRLSAADKEKSEKSQSLASPLVNTKQMKRTSGRNEITIRSSQRLVKEEQQPVFSAIAVDTDSWTNHLKLVAFTIVGILMIFWVMHPNSKV